MGADLILAHLDVTELWDDPDRARTELHRRCDAAGEPPDWYDGDADGWRGRLREHVEVILDGSARDLTTIEVAGRTILLTGGMSWGDSPTEALDAFTDLDEAGILVEPWPWATASDSDPWLVVEGGPIGGFSYYGPYPNSDAAMADAECKLASSGATWWVVQTEWPL